MAPDRPRSSQRPSTRGHVDGGGPALFAGGGFPSAIDSGDSYLARWAVEGVVLDFATEDDFATALANGQDLSSPPEFGALLSISSSGPNARAAIFDSTPGGPNDPSQVRDLFVGSGNLVILQTDESTSQTVPGIFDLPNDDEDGGTIAFDFAVPVALRSIALVDIDSGADELTFVVLTDGAGRPRTYTVPPGWTGDRLIDGTSGRRTLDHTSLVPQPGYLSTATAAQAAGFDPTSVDRIEVRLGSSGAIDDLRWCRPDLPRRVSPRPNAAAGLSGPVRTR